MIECFPTSPFSWNYSAAGISCGSAVIEYAWFTEQGRILAGNVAYDIRKQGIFSGRWSLEQSGEVLAEAHKPCAMFRSFDVSTHALHFTVRAESAFTRAFQIIVDQQVVGRICPAHPFTRRATIQCSAAIPEHIQLFAFWLVGVAWKRKARGNH